MTVQKPSPEMVKLANQLGVGATLSGKTPVTQDKQAPALPLMPKVDMVKATGTEAFAKTLKR